MKIVPSIIALLGILFFYFSVIYFIANHGENLNIFFFTVLEIIITIILHFILYEKGYIFWFILPLAWLLCIIPSLYCYNVPRPIIGGKHFVFVAVLVLYILPPFVISSLLSIIYKFVLKK